MIQSFLISLEAASERRARSVAALELAGVSFTCLDAVDGRGWTPREVPAFGRAVSGGEQGCLASHREALRLFLASDARVALVVEDDIEGIDAGPLWEVAAWLEERDGWDVAHLTVGGYGFKTRWGEAGGVAINRAHLFPMTSAALLWSREGAEAFLDSAPDWPVDHALREWTLRRRSGLGLGRPLVRLGQATSLMKDRDDLLTPAYLARRKKRRRKDRARAAWNRLRWQLTGRWHF